MAGFGDRDWACMGGDAGGRPSQKFPFEQGVGEAHTQWVWQV